MIPSSLQQYENASRKLFVEKLGEANLILARPGFNLFSEIIYLNKQAIFFCEKGNPEMVDLIYQLAKKGIRNILPKKQEDILNLILNLTNKNKLNKYEIELANNCNGASMVAEEIINFLEF